MAPAPLAGEGWGEGALIVPTRGEGPPLRCGAACRILTSEAEGKRAGPRSSRTGRTMNTGSNGKVRVAIIGAGAVSDYHHVPAIKLDPRAELAGACDADPALLERRKTEWGIDNVTTDPEALCADPGVDAVIIATPNFTHKAIS